MELTPECYRRGAVAYAGYCKQTGGKSLISGDSLPVFDALKPAIQDAWAAAAIALDLDDAVTAKRATQSLNDAKGIPRSSV